MPPLLEARGISAGYGGITVVRDVHLRVQVGRITALLGANGAGKTTTVRAVTGAIDLRSGMLLSSGLPVSVPLHRRCRDGLAVVTERRAVIMSLSVRENMRVARVDAASVLTVFPELAQHLDRGVAQLSGGQQQMLALGIALGRRPKVLVADELSLGLAPVIVERLLRLLRVSADAGLGVLLVEQHIHQALSIADDVVVLQRGRVAVAGAANELRGRLDEIQSTYLAGRPTAPSV